MSSSPAVAIRSGTLDDVSELSLLNRVIQAVHIENLPDIFRPCEDSATAQWYRSFLELPGRSLWIAEVDGHIVGYLTSHGDERPETVFTRARRGLEIDEIFVR